MFIKRSECEILEVVDDKKIEQSEDKTRKDLEKIAKELQSDNKKKSEN
jgi:hypothetical protein